MKAGKSGTVDEHPTLSGKGRHRSPGGSAEESTIAKTAYADYVAMGPARSLMNLSKYAKDLDGTAGVERPYSGDLKTLQKWSAKFDWVERAEKYDAAQQSKTLRKYSSEQDKIRVRNLKIVQSAIGISVQAINDGTFKADTASDLERLLTLEARLLGGNLGDVTAPVVNIQLVGSEHILQAVVEVIREFVPADLREAAARRFQSLSRGTGRLLGSGTDIEVLDAEYTEG